MENPEKPTDETLKRKAYLEAMRLYQQGADAELIYARLDKQGIPEHLILQVLGNMQQEEEKTVKENSVNLFWVGIAIFGVGIVFLLGSVFFFSDIIIIPFGMIFTGLLMTILSWKKTKGH